MKVKRFTKLALAGVGLAATAATLTTATYAWYVTNSEVTATGVKGSVNSAGAGSLYIAENKWDTDHYTVGDYQFDLVLNEATKQNDAWVDASGVYTFDALEPQTKAKTERYGKATLGVDADASKLAYEETLKSTTVFFGTTGDYVAASGSYDSSKKYYTFATVTGSAYKTAAAADGYRDEHPVFSYTAAANENPEKYTLLETATADLVDETTYYVGTAKTINEYYASATSDTYYTDNTCDTPATGAYSKRTSYYEEDPSALIHVGDWVDAEGNATTGKFVKFAFWLRAEDGGTVNAYVNVDNTTQVQKDQKVQNRNGAGNQAVGSSLYVDAVQALRMSIYQRDGENVEYKASTTQPTSANFAEKTYYTKGGTEQAPVYTLATTFDQDVADENGYYEVSNVTEADYQLDKISSYSSATSTATAGGVKFTNVSASGYDAGVYYKNVVGKVAENTTASSGVSVDSNTGETSWNSVTLKAATDTYFEFKIWLEGSDMQCFDSCRGQTFTVDFRFELQNH